MAVDAGRLRADVIGLSGHKWLAGPIGTGAIWASPTRARGGHPVVGRLPVVRVVRPATGRRDLADRPPLRADRCPSAVDRRAGPRGRLAADGRRPAVGLRTGRPAGPSDGRSVGGHRRRHAADPAWRHGHARHHPSRGLELRGAAGGAGAAGLRHHADDRRRSMASACRSASGTARRSWIASWRPWRRSPAHTPTTLPRRPELVILSADQA